MKYSHFLFLVIVLFGLNSCFIADDAFGKQKDPKLSLKQKTQNIITEYIKDNSEEDSYYKYGFSDLIIHKPKKIILLDNLIKDRENKNINQVVLEKQITELEQDIKDNDLRYSIEMDHIYSLENKKTGKIELFESRFFVADSLKVKSTDLLMNIEMDDDQEAIYADYFYETTIFLSGDYYESRSLSKDFYNFFKEKSEQLRTIKQRSDFLVHTLWLCQQVKNAGVFNQTEVLEIMTIKRFSQIPEVVDYESIKFSLLYEINDGENLKGYYFFHKFSHLNNNKEEESVVQISFTPYYEITEILQTEKTYNQYFDE